MFSLVWGSQHISTSLSITTAHTPWAVARWSIYLTVLHVNGRPKMMEDYMMRPQTLWCLCITRYNKLLIRLVESLRLVFVINNKLRCLLEAFLKPSLMTSCTLIVKIKMTNNLKRLGQQESYDWWRSILLLINNII